MGKQWCYLGKVTVANMHIGVNIVSASVVHVVSVVVDQDGTGDTGQAAIKILD